MELLLKLDFANAMPIFKNFLKVMNEFVEHPDQVEDRAKHNLKNLYFVTTCSFTLIVKKPTSNVFG